MSQADAHCGHLDIGIEHRVYFHNGHVTDGRLNQLPWTSDDVFRHQSVPVASAPCYKLIHDLRAEAASDEGTIEEAVALLGHASSETTKRIYKRNLTRAKPGK
ncbi:MAG: hypothetical protein ABSF96_15920 [Steroidobacteraceae bacterium]